MIVWVNGAFGAGKTTLVDELEARWPQALVYDPEQVGFVLRDIVKSRPEEDFQDLPVWRQCVVDVGLRLLDAYGRSLLVPMTLINPDYLAEIHGGFRAAGHELLHFFLRVPSDVLRARIDAQSFTPDDPQRDTDVRAWRAAQIQRCEDAIAHLPSDTMLLNGQRPTGELADIVMRRVRPAQ